MCAEVLFSTFAFTFDLVPRGEEDLCLFSGELDLLRMATSVNLND